MYERYREVLAGGSVHRFRISRRGSALRFADALELWAESEPFRAFFISLLADDVDFAAYRWETPALTAANADREFEFVLVHDPGLAVPANSRPFASHFREAREANGVTAFPNLGGDALLVVPVPRGPENVYAHLAAFVRGAPGEQKHALWQAVGLALAGRVGERPVWVSTAGDGVAWLHVRLDDRPKYYHHAPYRAVRAASAGGGAR